MCYVMITQRDRRRTLSQPNKPLQGSTAEGKLDIGFPTAGGTSRLNGTVRENVSSSTRWLVIKDSWQYPEREEEGELLREATNKGVVNIARYYHHETVRVGGKDDNIRSNIREGLDITKAANYHQKASMRPPSTSAVGAPRKGRSSSNTGQKWPSSCTDSPLPPGKRRSCSSFPTKAGSNAVPNWVHRRVSVRDYYEVWKGYLQGTLPSSSP
ncbi:hypothetical protein DL95DRAFT_450719 [Leptodontidium sp. 2 PMI_412]|nr:hypothetical protein DL95DRAFT_450719 [Leptodontidium sp. 2 PMI_412]